jgi:hypothetical protein
VCACRVERGECVHELGDLSGVAAASIAQHGNRHFDRETSVPSAELRRMKG